MKKNVLFTLIMVSAFLFSNIAIAQITADVQKVATCTPTIDGTIDIVWDNVAEIALDQNYPDTDHAVDGELATDASGYWKGLWDDDYLYILIDIKDDEVIADNEADVINEKDDGFDIVLGLADDKMTLLTVNYDESGDAQLNTAKGCCSFEDDILSDLSGGCSETDDGFIMELALSISELGYTADAPFQFDIRFNDDDSAEEDRDAIISWSLVDVGKWNTLGEWGNVTLKSDAVECPVTDALFKSVAPSFKVYPNPASEVITLTNVDLDANIAVLNMVGQEVLTTVSTDVIVELNVANLVSGVYFVKVGDAAQKIIIE